jgi:hypothetical protein
VEATITVAASTEADARAACSNDGGCEALFARRKTAQPAAARLGDLRGGGAMRRTWLTFGVAFGLTAAVVAAQILVAGTGPAAAATGIELVVVSGGHNSDDKRAIARCPVGKQVLGGGGRVLDGEGFVVLAWAAPDPDLGGFQAIGREVPGGYGAAWEVVAYAICAAPIDGLQYVAARAQSAPGGRHVEATASCPAGKRVVGAGGRVGPTLDYGESIAGESLQWIQPFDEGDAGYVVASATYDENVANPYGFWVWAYAVCAFPPPGYELRSTLAPADGSPHTGRLLQVSTRCTPGKKVLGAGLGGFNFHGTARVDEVFPAADLGGAWVVARQPAASNPLWLVAWAICAD